MGKNVHQRSCLILSFLLISGAVAAKETPEAKAARIHQSVFTIDTHSDTPLNLLRDDFDVAKRNDQTLSLIHISEPTRPY